MDEDAACRRNVSEALAAYLERGRLSKSKVSDDTGIARQTLDDILKQDRLVSTETLIKLATYFGTTAGAMLSGLPQFEATLPDAQLSFTVRLSPIGADLSDDRTKSLELAIASSLGVALGGVDVVSRRLRSDQMVTQPGLGRLERVEVRADQALRASADLNELLDAVLGRIAALEGSAHSHGTGGGAATSGQS